MDISQIVPLTLSFVGMAAIGIIILVNDFRLLSQDVDAFIICTIWILRSVCS